MANKPQGQVEPIIPTDDYAATVATVLSMLDAIETAVPGQKLKAFREMATAVLPKVELGDLGPNSPVDATTVPVLIDLPIKHALKSYSNGKTIFNNWAYVGYHYPAGFVEILTRMAGIVTGKQGGGEGKTEDDKFAYNSKRADAWHSGSYDIVEKASPIEVLMQECYFNDMIAAMGVGEDAAAIKRAEGQIRGDIKATVTKYRDKDTKATFLVFLECTAEAAAAASLEADKEADTATVKAETLAALIEEYKPRAEALRIARQAASKPAEPLKPISILDLIKAKKEASPEA